MAKDLYFLIKGGQTLELVKSHIAARQEQHERNAAFVADIGADQWYESILDGTVSGVILKERRTDFTKPDRKGISHPKKGTEWFKRWENQTGWDRRGYELAKTFGVPTNINYKKEGSEGWGHISHGLTSGVGFLYLSADGPYCLYVPDVAERVQYYRDQGYTVDLTWPTEFDGAHPILKEEWELIVAQHAVDEARGRE